MKFLVFISILAAQASALDFSIAMSGPHHVTVGHPVTFIAKATLLSGANESAVPTVTGLPAGAGVSFPNLKFCCTTFMYTLDDPLPIRVDVPAAAKPGFYPLTITYKSKSIEVRTAQFMLSVDAAPLPSSLALFPPDVPLAGLAQFESNMKTFGAKHCVPTELVTWEGYVWYYDGTRIYYQIADYTKDPKWIDCARALNVFYSNYVLSNAGNIQGWRVFPHGLALGYLREGLQGDKLAIALLLDRGYANFLNGAYVIDWKDSREISYGLSTHLISERLGNPRHANYWPVVEALFGHFSQWFLDPTPASYVQPFMVALGAEALTGHFDSTGDLRVLPTLQLAADRLWSDSWNVACQCFLYYDDVGTNPPSMSQDLNLLIAPLFGWVYQHTGLVKYRDQGDQIFNSGVRGAWLDGGKQFAENYRWSGKYIEWRNRPPDPAPPPDVLCKPVTPPTYPRPSWTCTF